MADREQIKEMVDAYLAGKLQGIMIHSARQTGMSDAAFAMAYYLQALEEIKKKLAGDPPVPDVKERVRQIISDMRKEYPRKEFVWSVTPDFYEIYQQAIQELVEKQNKSNDEETSSPSGLRPGED